MAGLAQRVRASYFGKKMLGYQPMIPTCCPCRNRAIASESKSAEAPQMLHFSFFPKWNGITGMKNNVTQLLVFFA